jgi:hypothetical protein
MSVRPFAFAASEMLFPDFSVAFFLAPFACQGGARAGSVGSGHAMVGFPAATRESLNWVSSRLPIASLC